jgi:T-complex protein 1 subunit zeta
MGSLKSLNPNAETMGRHAALFMNINAAKGLHEVMKSNLGPKGTIKMLVDGAGGIKLTKDGNVLLREMQVRRSGNNVRRQVLNTTPAAAASLQAGVVCL